MEGQVADQPFLAQPAHAPPGSIVGKVAPPGTPWADRRCTSGGASRVGPAGTPCAAPAGSNVSRVGPAGAPCAAPPASNVSRVAAAYEAVASQVLCFDNVTLRYACVTLALRSVFYSVTLRYSSS